MKALPVGLALLAAALTGCTSERQTLPQRTATEQLLISTAVDHALQRLDLEIPPGALLWIDAGNFDAFDEGYAIAAIRDRLLRLGGRIASARSEADAIVELRAGALSIDQASTLIGIPSIAVPVPLTGIVDTPELSLLKRAEQRGIAKVGLTIYDARTGALLPWSPRGPVYGDSELTRWVVLFLLAWTAQDILPESAPPSRHPPPTDISRWDWDHRPDNR